MINGVQNYKVVAAYEIARESWPLDHKNKKQAMVWERPFVHYGVLPFFQSSSKEARPIWSKFYNPLTNLMVLISNGEADKFTFDTV